MARSTNRVCIAAACFVCVAAAEAPAAAFDPPFNFPALKGAGLKGSPPPAEEQFINACFQDVYGMLHQNSKELLRRPSGLPDALMPSCLQEDKKGCHRFAEQLMRIVEAKQKEGPLDPVKVAAKVSASKAKTVAQTKTSAAEKAPVQVKKVEQAAKAEKVEKAKTAAPPAPKHSVHKPGSRVKFEERDMDFLQLDANVVNSDPKPLLAAVAAKQRLSVHAQARSEHNRLLWQHYLEESHRRPVSYNDWCSNLYAVATSTFDPTKEGTHSAASVSASITPPRQLLSKTKEVAKKVPQAKAEHPRAANHSANHSATPVAVSANASAAEPKVAPKAKDVAKKVPQAKAQHPKAAMLAKSQTQARVAAQQEAATARTVRHLLERSGVTFTTETALQAERPKAAMVAKSQALSTSGQSAVRAEARAVRHLLEETGVTFANK